MFGSFKLCATVMLAASVVMAIDIQAPEAPASGGEIVVKWTPDPTLREFSMELTHPDFNAALAIATSVNPEAGEVSVMLPPVPPTGGYTIEFVNVTDINDVFGTSPEFSIAPPVSTSETPTPSETLASETASGASATATMPMTMSGMSMSGMPMSGMSASASASSSASAKHSAASTTASSAAIPDRIYGASTAVTCTGAVLLGLLSAAWIL
ncbi:hypothetical protein FB451DRAFT_1359084 [Mycena latifolia]|nr:hypothetical protein FB451DRAFT_1359084 [Mycena latifolia]